MTCNRTIQLKSRKLAVARLGAILPCAISHVVMATPAIMATPTIMLAWLPSDSGTEG